jgi:uncharacterized protein
VSTLFVNRRYARPVAAAADVVDDPEAGRFELRLDGVLAGVANYTRRDRRVVITHTEVEDAFEGRGVGSALARGALDAIRAQGDWVVPVCPFLAGYIAKHAEYQDLVDTGPFGDL